MIIATNATAEERAEARVAYWTREAEHFRKVAEQERKRFNRARNEATKHEAGKSWSEYLDAYDRARYQLTCAEDDLIALSKGRKGRRDA